MFEQHPVPQQISSYQFRLVGDMTIKQFFQIAAGGIVALIIYGMPFPGFVKWPLIVIAALSGAAFAFLPIQDRPLEQWLFAFIRSIYSPTYFVWQKQDPPPQYFQQPDPNAVPAKTQLTPEQQHAEDLKNGVQEESKDEFVPDFIANSEDQVQSEQNANSQQQEVNNQQTQPTQPVQVDQSLQNEVNNTGQGQVLTDSNQENNQQNQKQDLQVPTQEAVELDKKGYEQKQQEQVYSSSEPVQTNTVGQVLTEDANQQAVPEAKQAQFSPDAAPPIPPDLPNIIKGQVMDSEGHIIDGAILEIKDKDGRPVRALRSNKAGHFQIVTSLPNGTYRLIIDKEGYEFDPISIDAKGELINPIAIRAK